MRKIDSTLQDLAPRKPATAPAAPVTASTPKWAQSKRRCPLDLPYRQWDGMSNLQADGRPYWA